jgi:hypothetical protein
MGMLIALSNCIARRGGARAEVMCDVDQSSDYAATFPSLAQLAA